MRIARVILAFLFVCTLSQAQQRHGLEPVHFDAILMKARSHAIKISTNAPILSEDAVPVLVWRPAVTAGWRESRAVPSKVIRRLDKTIGRSRALFPLWVVNGRLFEADPDVLGCWEESCEASHFNKSG
jgi:hypothetical protein